MKTIKHFFPGRIHFPVYLAVWVLLCVHSQAAVQAQNPDSGTGAVTRIVVSSIRPRADGPVITEWGITRDEYDRIRKLEGISNISPIRKLVQTVRFGDRQADVSLMGTSPDYRDFHSLPIQRGRFLTEKDLKKLNNVAVVGDGAARSLFPGQDPIGKNVRIGNNYFLVVGIAGTGSVQARRNPQANRRNKSIYLPISTMRSRMGDISLVREEGTIRYEQFELSEMELKVLRSQAREIAEAIRQLLRQSHDPKDYQIEILASPQNESS